MPLRLIRNRAMYALGALLLTGAGLLLLLHLGPVQQALFRLRMARLQKSSGIAVTASEIHINLFAGTARLQDLTIHSLEQRDLPPFLTIRSATVRFSTLRLGQGLESIASLRLQEPAIQVVTAADGRSNLPESRFSAPTESISLPAALEIEGGSLRFADASRNLKINLPRWSLTLNQSGKHGHVLSLTMTRPGSLEFGSRTLPIENLRGAGAFAADGLEIRSLSATLGPVQTEVRGWLHNLSNPALNLTWTSRGSLPGLLALLDTEPLPGEISAEINLRGRPGSLEAEGSLEAAVVSYQGTGPWSAKSRMQYSQSESRIALTSLSAHSPSGTLQGSGALSLRQNQGGSFLEISARDLNLANVLNLLGSTPPVAGRVSGTARASWVGTGWRTASARANLQLAPDITGNRLFLPLEGSVLLEGDSRGLTIRPAPLTGPGFAASGRLRTSWSGTGLEGEFAVGITDIAALLDAVRRSFPEAIPKPEAPMSGSASFTAKLAGSFRAPRIAASIESSLALGQLDGIGVSGPVEYSSGLLRMPETTITWRGQDARLSGQIDLQAKPSPAMRMEAGFDRIALREVMAGLAPDVPVGGLLSGHLTGRGTLKQPEMEGTLHAEDLTAWGETFGTLTASARMSGSELILDQFRLEKKQTDGPAIAEGSGRLDWEERTLQFQAKGEGLRLESKSPAVGGTLSFEASGKGSLSGPHVIARAGVEGLEIKGRRIGNVGVDAEISGLEAILTAEAPDIPASLRGSIHIQNPFPARLMLDSPGARLQILSLSLGKEKVAGSASLRVEADGPLARPADMTAKAIIADLEVRAGGQELRSRSPIALEWSRRTLRLQPARLISGEAVMEISGSLPLSSGSAPGEISISGTASLPDLMRLAPEAHGLEAKGLASVNGKVLGSLEKLYPSLQVSLHNAELRFPGVKPAVTALAADLRVNADGIEARRIEGKIGAGWLHFEGSLPLSFFAGANRGQIALGTLRLDQINPGDFLADPARLGGSISLLADFEAREPTLESIQGMARFPELKLRAGELEIAQHGESRVRLADGRLLVEQLDLKGLDTAITVSGYAALTGSRGLNLKLSGSGDARLLSAAGSGYDLAGALGLRLDVGGTLDKPEIQGFADLKNGRFFLGSPQLSGEELQGRAEFSGRRVQLTGLAGELNGGKLEAEGSLEFGAGGVENLLLKATGRNIFMDYPKGLRTISNLDLAMRSEGNGFIIDGKAEMVEGEHREAINVRTFQQSKSGSAKTGSLPERIRFNVNIRTLGPLSVDNNLARLDAYADLRLAGTAARPALLGRLELDEGGRVYISERVFTIVRAAIDFNSEKSIEPSLDLDAQTRIGEYLVTYRATGGLKDLESSWSSDPNASQEQIYSLLLTGSIENTDKISGADMMSRQAFSLFGTTMMGGFNVRVRRAIGFSEFRIEPSLISADSDPTARLTVGQNLTPSLSLTYSTDLGDSNDQIWIVEYDWRRKVLARYISQTEDSDQGSLLHKVQFGGGPDTGDIRTERRRADEKLESIEISGNLSFPEEAIRKQVKLKPGAKYDFLKIQDRLKDLGSFYAKEGYLEARIRQERERGGKKIALKLRIESGPRVSFAYSGADVPGKVKKKVSEAWRSGFADAQRLQAAAALIRQHLFRKRFCDAAVTGEVESPESGAQTVKFTIVPGPEYRRVEMVLKELDEKRAKQLQDSLRRAKLDSEAASDPETVRRFVARELRDQGFLAAAVDTPRIERNPETGTFSSVIPVRPGPSYRLGRVIFEGNRALTEKELLSASNAQTGRRYLPEQRQALADSVESVYWNKGYRDALVDSSEKTDPRAGTVDLVIRIEENTPSVIAGIKVEGNAKTSEEFVRRRVPLAEGSKVEGEKVSLLRRRLTNSGAYKLGDLTFRPSATAAKPDGSRPVDLVIRVREPKPFRLEYGLNYDSETGIGGLADFSVRNLLGEGRLLGYRISADTEQQDQRIYFSQPFLGRRDITTTVDLERERQIREAVDYTQNSLTVQQLVEFRRKFTLSYGYRYRQVEGTVGDTVPFTGSITPLITTLSRDRRNDVFDATGGSYISQSLEYSPSMLGGSYSYYRYFGQFFKYLGLTRPAPVPGQQEEHPRFVFATGIRVGLLERTGGERLIPFPSERFFGGGSTTVRGFSQNSLGPQSAQGEALGGQAVFFLNNELRFPLYKFLDAAVFVDIGNVWAFPSEFSLRDVRKTAGFGIRLRNPLILLRFDYGWKLDRRPGEPAGAFHFGLGQAY